MLVISYLPAFPSANDQKNNQQNENDQEINNDSNNSNMKKIVGIFFLFLNLGLALWLGDILGKAFYGFLVVAGFYCVTGIVLHFLMHKWLKKVICNYIIRLLLKQN